MNKNYDLKEVIDKGLKQVKIDRELEESIKAQCLGKGAQRKSNTFKISKTLSTAASWLIGIILVLSGTAYAINHIEGFNHFIDENILQQIAPHVQTINKGNGKGEVKMVVEAAITDHYGSLLVFSFINESKEPWTEGVEVGYWDESWTTSSTYGPPVLSEDGRRLTYFVEGHSDKDILKDKEFELKAGNIILRKEMEEEIDIPLGELFKAHNIVVDTADYSYSAKSKDLYMKLGRMLKKAVGSTQRQVLKSEPQVTFEYVGMIQDSRLEDPYNPDGGLTLYTRNKSDKYWTNSGDDYTVGTISEVTDIRTGEVYKATTRAIEYDVDTLWQGALGVSQFRDLMDPSIIPYLKATKVTYEVQEVVAREKWKVKFEVEDTTTVDSIMTQLSFNEGSESITIKQVDCSVLGITIQGTREGKLENPSQDSIYEKIVLELKMKDGTKVQLNLTRMQGDGEKIICSYTLEDENGDQIFIDVEQIEEVIINGESVMLP